MACSCYGGNPVLDEGDTAEKAFKMPPLGALLPPELSWQEGQTAGYIASINLLLRLEAHLSKSLSCVDTDFAEEIDETLQWLKVKPAPKMRKDKDGKVEVLDKDGNVIGKQG